MTIRYKVVTPTRQSVFVTDPKYKIIYEAQTLVDARQDTLGIFVFEHKHQAEDYCSSLCVLFDCLILEVEPTCSGHRLLRRPTSFDSEIIKFLGQRRQQVLVDWQTKPFEGLPEGPCFTDSYDGTMVYDQIYVLT